MKYFTPFHKDSRDGDALSHCYFSPPNAWKKHPSTIDSVFSLEPKCFDISNANLHVNFLPSHSFHAIGKPNFVPEMPRSLSVNCIFHTVWNDKRLVTSFVGRSILVWGTWERRRAVTNKARRELEGREDRTEPSKRKKSSELKTSI